MSQDNRSSKFFAKRGSYASPDNCVAVNYEGEAGGQWKVDEPVIVKVASAVASKCGSECKSRGNELVGLKTCDKRVKRITELGDSLIDDTFLGKKTTRKWGNVKLHYGFMNRKDSAPKITAAY